MLNDRSVFHDYSAKPALFYVRTGVKDNYLRSIRDPKNVILHVYKCLMLY